MFEVCVFLPGGKGVVGQSLARSVGQPVGGALLLVDLRRHDDDGGYASGAVYVFRTTDGGATYAQVAKLTASDAAAADYFGVSVAMDGQKVVVGAYFDDDAGSS